LRKRSYYAQLALHIADECLILVGNQNTVPSQAKFSTCV